MERVGVKTEKKDSRQEAEAKGGSMRILKTGKAKQKVVCECG